MKPIIIDAYKPLPFIGQSLILVWTEKINGQKYHKSRSGYKLVSYAYEYNQLMVEIYSPNSERIVKTSFYGLCKDFTWHGDSKEPKFYEA